MFHIQIFEFWQWASCGKQLWSDWNGENWPGGPLEPGFIVSPLAWTTSTSKPPFLSIRPISTSPGFMKTDRRVRWNICVYIFFPFGKIFHQVSILYWNLVYVKMQEKESRADPGPSLTLSDIYGWVLLKQNYSRLKDETVSATFDFLWFHWGSEAVHSGPWA